MAKAEFYVHMDLNDDGPVDTDYLATSIDGAIATFFYDKRLTPDDRPHATVIDSAWYVSPVERIGISKNAAKTLHWVFLEAVEISVNRDLDPVTHGKEAKGLLLLADLIKPHGYDVEVQCDALRQLVHAGDEAAKSPMQKVRDLLGRIERRDKAMDDPYGDGTGNDSRPPTGDDYNDLFNDVAHTLKEVLKLEEK